MRTSSRVPALVAVGLSSLLQEAVVAQSVLYVDADATGPKHDGSTWCDGFLTLDEGLDAAGPGTIIRVGNGTYTPDPAGLPDPREATFRLFDGVTIEGGYAGCGAPDPGEHDVVAYQTILSGDVNGDDGVNCCYAHGTPGCVDWPCRSAVCAQDPFCCDSAWDSICANRANNICAVCADAGTNDNCYHVVTASGADAGAVLDGLTITRGVASGPHPHNRGGGMYGVLSAPTVRNCRFEANSAGDGPYGFGGAVYMERGRITFTECTFTENIASATVAQGGAVFNEGGDMTLGDCSFFVNAVSGSTTADGGGVGSDNSGTSTFNACEFLENFSALAGGAVSNRNGSHATFTDCTFEHNEAQASGGAMSNKGRSDTTLTDCAFTGNVARGADAGAIFNMDWSNPTLIRCTFDGNSGGAGGAIRAGVEFALFVDCTFTGNSSRNAGGAIELGGDAAFVNCTFTENSADFLAGALSLHSSDSALLDCVFTANTSQNDGGAIDTSNTNVSITACIFSENSAGRRGGAMYNSLSTATISDSRFIANVAADSGGAILNAGISANTPSILRSTFIANAAGENGGGVYSSGVTGPLVTDSVFVGNLADNRGGGMFDRHTPKVTDCTFLGNSAAFGGGAYNWYTDDARFVNCTFFANSGASAGGGIYREQSDTTIVSSLLWGNTDPGGSAESAQIYNLDNLPSIHYSCVQGWTGAMGGTGNGGEDPLFADPDGGDLRLSPASPAINAGDPEFLPDKGATDLDGHARVLCGRLDMGAYEFGIGDFDCDRDVDLFDFAEWGNCYTGPSVPPSGAARTDYPPGCEAMDFNADGDVDFHDTAGFQTAFSPPPLAR